MKNISFFLLNLSGTHFLTKLNSLQNSYLETLFQQIKTSNTKVVPLTLRIHFNILLSSLSGTTFVFFQMKDKRRISNISSISRTFITNEKNLCTKFCEISGIVHSITKYEHNFTGFDQFKNVLNDHKPIFYCFTEKRNRSPLFYTAERQLSIFQKVRNIYTKTKKISQ